MTQKDYSYQVAKIDEQLIELYKKKKALQDAYLDEIAEFKAGDKVLVDGVPSVVVLRTLSLHKAIYDFKKLKKDGTVSNRNVWYTINSTFEKL